MEGKIRFLQEKIRWGEISIYDKDGNHLDEPALRRDNYIKMNSLISTATANIIAYAIAHPLTFILYDMADINAEYIPSYNWIYGGFPPTTAWKASNNLWGSDVNGYKQFGTRYKIYPKNDL